MLTITIPASGDKENYDEIKNEFVTIPGTKEQTLTMEHSLISLSKWESKWCKSFLFKKDKTDSEILDYIKCMTLTPNVPDSVYDNLTKDNLTKIHDYINAPMTATHFSAEKTGGINKETITSELIYYWMITLNVPVEVTMVCYLPLE